MHLLYMPPFFVGKNKIADLKLWKNTSQLNAILHRVMMCSFISLHACYDKTIIRVIQIMRASSLAILLKNLTMEL